MRSLSSKKVASIIKFSQIIPLILFVFISINLHAQDFTGQWKGEFIDKSTSFTGWGGDRCEYVLELECSGANVSGYSYTYFSDAGKRYYTICKLSGTINKASSDSGTAISLVFMVHLHRRGFFLFE